MSHHAKGRWKLILNLATFTGLIILIYAVRTQIVESLRTIGHIRWWWLLLLPVWQALNYDAYSRQNQGLFRILGSEIRYRFLYKVNLELNFVNHIFPSGGLSGFSYFSMRMKDKDISPAKSSLVQLMRFILVFISFQLFLFLALIMLSFSGHVNRFVLLCGGSLSTLILVGTIVIAYVIGSQKRINNFFGFITKALNRIIHVVRPKHPETINIARAQQSFEELHDNFSLIKADYGALKWPLVWSLVANLTEILTVYSVYLAFGHLVNPGAVILAFAVANFAGFLSVLPSGVGVYEALMTAILAVGGISPAVSIPVTVMYRVLSMAVQLLPGYVFYYRRLHKKTA
jgi:uncharacterized protein (TIRG00374 family)